MLTVVLPRTNEPSVVQMTQEQLQRELHAINGAELLVTESWADGLKRCRTDYVCFVEPDCLISSGYFSSLMGLYQKNKHFRKLAVMSASTGINNWGNKVFGYDLGEKQGDGINPIRSMKSSSPYAVQVAYIPGAIVRTSSLRTVAKDMGFASHSDDLVKWSANLSLALWKHGCRVYINPNSAYITTEEKAGQKDLVNVDNQGMMDYFKRESI